ncbi:putative defense protein Hdd11-like [Sergentomyia squamirostris]
MYRFVIVLVAVVALPGTWANSAGAPDVACKDLVPQHKVDPQSTQAPYSYVLPQKRTVTPGESIQVTVRGNSKTDTIKGFLVQARLNGDTTPIGTFSTLPGQPTQNLNCGTETNALTHKTITTNVEEISFKYTVPTNAKKGEKFQFFSTVAIDGYHFWVRIPSDTFTVA